MLGPIDLYGLKESITQAQMQPKNPKIWIGIYGWELQNLNHIPLAFIPLTGEVFGIMAPVL